MAEIDSSAGSSGNKGGKIRSKKASTKVDMTPMVDLAFLLITFFMLTTTLSKPKAMQVNMPDNKTKKKQEVIDKNTITIVAGEDDKLFYYTGIKQPEVHSTNYSSEGLRKVLYTKNKEIGTENLIVVIKAMNKSKYKNIVDILDEMHITNTKRFAVMDITPQDLEIVKKEEAHIASGN
jgi:biopolymer transport protein ExbD